MTAHETHVLDYATLALVLTDTSSARVSAIPAIIFVGRGRRPTRTSGEEITSSGKSLGSNHR